MGPSALSASTAPGTVAPTQTISGTLFDSGGSPITSGRTVKLLQNGTSFGTTTTNGSGSYGFTGVTLASGDKIVVYISGAGEKGATVTLSGTADITNLNIRQNSLIVRTDNGGSITNANLKEGEGGSPDADLTAVRMVDGTNVLTLPAGFNLQIWSGSTYAPGADIHDAGNWTNNGAFAPATHTVTFDGNSNQTINGSSSTTFYALTISNTGTSPANHVTLDGSAGATNTVVSLLNINTGVFDQGTASASSDLEVNGSTFGTCIFVQPGGQWINTGWRDVTLFCDVSNQGTIEFNSNGTACGQPDDILVRSNVIGIQRTWAGPGTFSMTDVNVRDQRVPGGLSLPQEILVNSGTNAGNNTGWIFSSGCDAYTWIGAFGQDWANPYNWSPVRYTANNAFTSDVLIFDGNVTPSPLVNSTTQTNASIQLKNGVALTLDPIGGGTLTLNGGTGSDLDVPAGTLLKFEGFNPLVISLTGPGHQCDVGGQIIMEGSSHKLRGANPGEITMSGANAFTTQSGFTGNPFGESPNGAVVFQSGSTGTFNAGDDPFGGLNSVVTFNSGSTARFGATSAFSTSGRTYGNLILGGNQNYPTLLAGTTTVQNNFVLESGSSWTLSGDLNLLGNFEDQNLLAGKFNVNSRTVRFQGGSATQTIFKPGTNPLNFGDVFIAKPPGGKVQLLSSVNIGGQLSLATSDSLLELNGQTLELNGTITGSGNLKGSAASTLHIGGIGALGTLNFLTGFQTLSELKMDRVLPSGSVTLGNDLTVNDTLLLTNGVVKMGAFTLTINGAVNRFDGYIIGNEQRFITCANTCPGLTFDVGTLNGYSPVNAFLHVGAIPGTYTQTIKAIQGQHPSIHGVGVNALQRYWTLSSVTGPAFSHADLTFNYLAGDVVGTPAAYVFFKNSAGVWSQAPPAATPTTTSASINGVNSFSDWTLAQAAAVTPGNLQFLSANYANAEQNLGTHTATISVRRVGGTDGAVSVHWATSAGTATPGSDYAESSGDLNWADGDSGEKTFTVTVIGDTVYESDETVNLTLSAPTGLAALGTPNPATLTITNDDSADTDVALLGGNLQIIDINGGNTDDTLTISLNGSNVRTNDPNHTINCGAGATVIDANTCEVSLASITGSIQVHALAGSDSLTLALGGGNFFPPGGVAYHGGDPTTGPGDKLFITGGSQGTVTYHYTNANDGSIAMSNVGTVTYSGLEPIINTGTATDVIFELPPGPNAVTLADDGTVGNTMSRLSGVTIETTDFANPTASLAIKRGNAADTVAVNVLPDFNANLAIGSAGNEFGIITFHGAIALAVNNSLSANASSAINLSNGANALTTSGTGTFNFTAANVMGAGNVSTDGGLTITNTGSISGLSGVISGTGGLTKLGTGTLTLSNTNTYTGATAVNLGRLNINGSIDSNTTVSGSATIGGTGTINSTKTLTVNDGVLAPGTSPGIFNTGNVTLNSSSTFAVEDGGTTPGNLATNHDQLNVTGTVSLGNATLSLSPLSFTPSAGQAFVIINNDDTDAVTGTFNGLPEGATIPNFLGSDLNATITYVGGTGNDVVLMAFAPVLTPGNLQFSAANYNDTEQNSGTHLVTITVQRVGGTDGAVSVHWATSAGTATPGSDYTESAGDLSWADGNAADQTFTVTVSGDTAYEFNETVNLTLSAPTGNAGLGTPNPATLTITNDDVADSDVVLSGVNLQITDVNGGNSDDTLTISLNGSNVRITDPNHTLNCGASVTAIDANTCELPLASITGSIQFNALAGSDSLTLDLAAGNFFPPGGVTYSGGDPTIGPGDKLFITGGSQGTVTYHYTNAHDGTIAMSNVGTVTYTGLEPISNTGTATNVIFELPAGPNAATLADDVTGGNAMSRLSGATFETTDFANPTASLTINRGNAADAIAVNALPDFDANLTIGSAGNEFDTITFNGPITLATNNSLATNASSAINLANGANILTTSGTGTINFTAANVTGAGNVSTGGGLTVSNTGSSSTLSGVIAGPGGLTKLGAGTLVLSSANTYTGATAVNLGRLNINGSIDSNTTVGGGATLGGTGTINSTKTLTVNDGVLAPGTSPGILNTGNATLNSSSTFAVEIGGTTPGNLATNHDQLNVTGTVSLGNATLNLSPLSFTPSAGQTFVIINNDGTDAVTGTFNGLPEGATIPNFLGSALKATITYQGGTDNNDVVLTAATPVPGNLQFSAANYDDTEQNSGTHTATITVQRVGGIDGAVSVHWATSAGTATPASDYTESSGDLNWAAGDAADQTFTVTVIGDTAYEFDETVNLTLSAPTGGAGLGTPNPATLTITNDDVADSHVSLLGGNLQITDVDGGISNDTLTLSLNGSNLRITDPNHTTNCGAGATAIDANTCEVPLASITGSIQVNTLGGNDSLTLDLAAGNFFPPGGVTYNGGDPTTAPGDKLFITGGSQGTVTYHYTNAHDGTIVMSNIGPVTYTGLDPISNTGTAADIIFELPPGSNDATLADDGTVGNTMLRLSGATFETTDFANPTASLTIKRGSAADTVAVNTLPDFNASLTIGSFSTITFNGAITLAANNSLAANASVAIDLSNGANILSTSGTGTISLTAANVTGGGNLSTSGGLTISNTGSSSILSGVIAGPGGLTKLGAGTLALSGTNTYTGATAVNLGQLNIDGSIDSNTTVSSGATLGGRGTINSTKTLTVNDSVLAPGTSPGILNTGNVTLNSSSTFAVEIGGATPGNLATNHDQLNVTGTVSLGNAVLSLASFNSFTPAIGQTFIIINNDGTADTVTGTFNGLPEGATIPNFLGSALKATISYQGGDGNDVVLTAAAPVSGNLQFSAANYNDTEQNSSTHPVTITVQRVGGIDGAVSVHWATSAGTATPGSDYTESTGDLNWADGDAADKTFTVTVIGDTASELNETVNLTLSAPTGGAGLGTPNLATLTITNDDFCPTTLTVNNSGDEPDATPGDSVCETATGNGFCTLRAAIMESNALASCAPLTIDFALLPGSEPQQIALEGPLPTITHSVTIQGPVGQMVSVDGADTYRILEVASDVTANISNLIFTNGSDANDGAGLRNNGGTVNVSNCVFTGNQTSDANGAAIANNSGTLNVWNSTFSVNQVNDSGNGGAIYVNSGTVTLTNDTISENGAADNAGGVYNNAGTVNVRNTIIAGNLSPGNSDVQGTFISQGHNIIGAGDGATGFVDGSNGDHVGTEGSPFYAALGPFDDHGGTTLTYSLLPTSAALEGGDNCVLSGCTGASPTITTDQRNVTRPQSAKVDIGAYEMDTSVVNTTADHAPGLCEPLGPPGADCTLREAINVANASTNPTQITFNIPTDGSDAGCVGGVCTIALDSVQGALPEITQPVMIDGYSQTGATPNTQNLSVGDNATLTIVLRGFASPGLIGLDLCAGSTSSAVKGLVINNFQGSGIQLENDGLNLIAGNFIGTDATAMNPVANGNGVVVVAGIFNEIGGQDPAARNIISGNTGDGVQMSGDSTGVNSVEGNYIGTRKDGDSALSNNIGVNMFGFAGGNIIGCETENGDNVISGNTTAGIRINESDSNTIEGNLIGTDKTGVHAIPNGVGVDISDSADNAVGFFGFGSVISGNTGAGVQIKTTPDASSASFLNLVYSNKIGTNAAGTAAIPNDTGIVIQDSSVNDIGSGDPADRNLVSGNTHEGVRLENANDTIVFGNFIGTDTTGSAAIPNAVGVKVNGGSANEIGCTVPGSTNVISGNTGDGVEITSSANGNFVQSNLIGVQVDGISALANGGVGVEIYVGATNNTVGVEFGGGTTRAARDSAAKASAGSTARADTASPGGGCSKRASVNNQNTKAFKAALQLKARAAKAVQNSSQLLGRAELSGRAMKAVADTSASTKVAGRTAAKALTGAKVQGIAGKGLAPSFTSITGANVIANNVEEGVKVSSPGDINNLISQNSIYANGKLGINLVGGAEDAKGVTANDTNDSDTGPNLLQNYPVVTSAITNGGSTTISGTLNSNLDQDYVIEFFVSNDPTPGKDPSGFGEGQTFIGTTTATTSGNDATFTFSPAAPLTVGSWVTATATDGSGNTSEFSGAVQVTPPISDVSVAIVSSAAVLENSGTDIVYRFSRTDTSNPLTVDFSVGGTASFTGLDYTQTGAASFTNTSGQVTFSALTATVDVSVHPTPDTNPEADETVTFSVVAGSGYVVVTPSTATGTILTDDVCPTSFTVNQLSDTHDFTPGDGVCGDVNQQCTLRAAVEEANALVSCGTIDINFNLPFSPSIIVLPLGQLSVDHNVNIIGPTDKSLTIDGNGTHRAFNISSASIVSISNLTINDCVEAGNNGGGILNNGTLTLNGVLVEGNSAVNGGGIASITNNSLTLINTTISGNSSTGNGGGLYNDTGSATLTNVTIAYNTADSDNVGSESGGGLFVASGVVTLHNTIVADNLKGLGTADDIGGLVNSTSSYNLIGTGSGGLTNGGNNNQVGTASALLKPLQENGGPTRTHALTYKSPAVDTGDDCVITGCSGNSPMVAVDQRGLSRTPPPDGDANGTSAVDIGAYERQATESREVFNGFNSSVDIVDVIITFPCVLPCEERVNPGRAKRDSAVAPAAGSPAASLASIDPAPLDSLSRPPNLAIGNSSSPPLPAFEVTTTASYTPPATLCFYLPAITDATFFAGLKVLHREAGPNTIYGDSDDVMVDRTRTTSPTDFANKLVCSEVSSFSAFAIAHTVTPTVENATVSGQILDNQGNPVEGAAVRMNGTQNRLTVTDAAGRYHFDEVATNGLYVVTPSRANFTFSPSQRSFSQLGANTEATFTATAGGGTLNPLDTTEYFVRQQYLDFLGREPDEAGFSFWVSNIESCGNDAGCREVKRIDVGRVLPFN
jgi:CSLREA domain-containing protein